MSGTVVQEAVTALRAAYDALAGCGDLDALTLPDLLAVADDLQTVACQLPTQRHRMLARLQAEATPKELGAKSWRDVLRIRFRISGAEAGRWLTEAALLGPRRTLTGQPLDPVLACTAAAQAAGSINAEHVKVICTAMDQLPGFVDAATRDQIEADLVGTAVGVGPTDLDECAALILYLLDQDGPAPDDTERDRTRGITMGRQQRGGNTTLDGNLTPELAAMMEVLCAKFAAPGMCNPADPEPCTSGTPSQAQIDNDHRSLAQRQHDALIAVLRIALMGGDLGKLNGLPVSVIIRTTLQDLRSEAGVGVTGGGTVLPIAEVIRLAAHANHYLAVFDKATGSALDLFRAQRIASPAQRIMLISRDGGCTKPCCPVGPYGSQVHHAARDWGQGGQTNVDDLGLACGPDNRMVGDGGWTTSINAHGQVEWAPPPHLDTGQTRINTYHHPERLLHPPNNPTPADEPGEPPPPPETIRDDGCPEPQPPTPVEDEPVDESGGSPPLPEAIGDEGCSAEIFDPVGNEPADDTGAPPPPDPIGNGGGREPEHLEPVADDDTGGHGVSPPPEAIADGGGRDPQPFGPVTNDDADDSGTPAPDVIADGGCDEPQPSEPVANDHADQPGGPAPPDDQAA